MLWGDFNMKAWLHHTGSKGKFDWRIMGSLMGVGFALIVLAIIAGSAIPQIHVLAVAVGAIGLILLMVGAGLKAI
jgi:hypothetical protein